MFALYVLHLIESKKHIFTRYAHVITPTTVSFATSRVSSEPLPPSLAKTFCRTHNFAPFAANAGRRKVYDLFLLNTELDWLEIRLETLASSVDYFVIVESPITFTGLSKPLILKENWARFSKYHSQIIHHVLVDPPKNAERTWDVEDFQRNAMFSQVFPYLGGEKAANLGDVIVVSDVDEIPRPATMVVLRNCDIPKRVTLRSQFYYYSFQWLHRGSQWKHGQATTFGGVKPGRTILPNSLRIEDGEWNKLNVWWETTDIWNAGWHCSTCFQNVSQVLEKMGAFSHTSLNQKKFRAKKRIVDRVRNGKDLWDREGENYDRVEHNEDVPEYLKSDRGRWKYLLDRDGENAGFADVS